MCYEFAGFVVMGISTKVLSFRTSSSSVDYAMRPNKPENTSPNKRDLISKSVAHISSLWEGVEWRIECDFRDVSADFRTD